MTVIEHHAPAEEPAPDLGARAHAPRASWRTRPLLHVALLVLVVVGVLATGDLEASWTSDDGAYAVQTELVRETGEWEYPHRHAEVDPSGAAVPIAHSSITVDGRTFPYVKQPGWIIAMVASTRLAGPVVGLHLPAALGLVLAAVTALLLATDIAPRWRLAALWAVGLGPLLVQATALWAHTTAAALGGVLALLVARRAAGRPAVPLGVLGVASAAVVCLLRNEGVLLVAASGLVLAALAVPPQAWRARLGHLAWSGAVVVAGAAGLLLNRRWVAALVDGAILPSLDAPTPPPFVSGRVTGLARTFLDGAGTSATGTLLALVAVLTALAAGRALRQGESAPALGLAAVALGLLVVRTAVAGIDDLGGLLVAAPLLAVGVGAGSVRGLGRPVRALLAMVGLTLAFTVLVQYAEGGGREWGGRYTLTVIVPATVLAVASVGAAARALPAERQRVGAVLAAALVVVPTLAGLWATRQIAADARATGDRLAELDESPVIVTARFVPRLGWRHLPEADWLLGRPDEVEDLLVRLRPTLDGPVVVLGPGISDLTVDGYRREVRSESEVVFHPRP